MKKRQTQKRQTPQEIADELRKKARDAENMKYQLDIRRAVRRNPELAAHLKEMDALAAQFRKMADDFELEYGHMTADEFAALNAQADAWAELHPEEAEQVRRDVGRMSVAGE